MVREPPLANSSQCFITIPTENIGKSSGGSRNKTLPWMGQALSYKTLPQNLLGLVSNT